MRIYILIVGVLMATVASVYAAPIYLDDINNIDLIDSQNISGGNSTLPASKPIVLDDVIVPIISGTSGGQTGTGIVVEEITKPETPNPINQLPDLQRDAEFLMSLRWIYDQGITKFSDPDKFMPENYLTRVDAAKMLSILSRKVFGNSTVKNTGCGYSDINGYDTTTQGQIKDACELGIFKPATVFNPDQGITRGQLIAVLVRMFDRKVLDENTTPWYKNYVQRGWEIGLLPDRSTAVTDGTISRLDVSKLLYKLRNIHLNKTPTTQSDNPLFITILNKSGSSFQALIDVEMIRNDKLKTLEMKLDPVTYYFAKDKVYNYGASLSNFQVYGYVYASSEMITPVGVGTRRVQQGVVQEGSLVIWGNPQTIYSVKPNNDASLYIISKTE